jgi:HlyD family secretion protein
MTSFFQKTKLYITAHKPLSIVVGCMLLFGIYYGIFHKQAVAETRYVTTPVTTGTVVASVTGSGQVSASNEINLQAKASGTITSVNVKAGDVVKKGRTLIALDATDAEQAVKTAQTNLETAQLDLDEFTQAPDSVSVLALKKAITDAQTSKTNADTAITDAYQTVLNSSVTAVSSDLNSNAPTPTISGTYTKGVDTVITITAYQSGTSSYFNASSTADAGMTAPGKVSAIIPQPIGDTGLFIKFPSTNVGNSTTWTITLPNKSAPDYASNYTLYQNAITNKQQVDDTADLTIAQSNDSISKLYTPDPLQLRAKQIAVQQAQDALDTATANLSNYYVVAPFDGTVATVTAQVGNTASGTLGTIITNQQLATISLNEVDVAKINLGDKATLTFDAVDGLSIAGQVAAIDSVGTVSSGVVNYNVQISFATQDARIKSGMSATAAIVTAVHQDVLTVPNSAIKTTNGTSMVQVFDTPLPAPTAGTTGSLSAVPPRMVAVTPGLSDDTNTEITSGLTEGQLVVSRTITSSAKTTTAAATAPSLLGGAATRGGAGGGNAGFRGGTATVIGK